MVKVRIKGIKILMYAGILSSEKRRRQRIEFDVEYIEPEKGFIDYSKVCLTLREIALSRKWGLLEELLKAAGKSIRENHKGISGLKIAARKRKPCGMKDVSSAEVEIASE